MTTTAEMYRLEVFRDNLGTWRWRTRGPEGVFAHSAALFATRGEAREEGESFLLEQGLEEGSWSVWMDGLSEHGMAQQVPRVDPTAEARAAGLTPPDPEEAARVRQELEARKQGALEARRLAMESKGADEGMAPDAPKKSASPEEGSDDANPIVQQARKRRKAKEA